MTKAINIGLSLTATFLVLCLGAMRAARRSRERDCSGNLDSEKASRPQLVTVPRQERLRELVQRFPPRTNGRASTLRTWESTAPSPSANTCPTLAPLGTVRCVRRLPS
jgi:hypothetical protein